MFKSILRDYLDLIDQEKELEKIHSRIDQLEEKIEDKDQETMKELEDLKQMFYESRPVTSELSQKERQLLEIFLEEDTWKDKRDISQELEISRNYSGTLLSRLKEKVELQEKQVDQNGRKAFKLHQETKNRIEKGY